MLYSRLFFEILINVSLVTLVAVFCFQAWAFYFDYKNKNI